VRVFSIPEDSDPVSVATTRVEEDLEEVSDGDTGVDSDAGVAWRSGGSRHWLVSSL
jgi:hypothetical protein